MPKILSKIKIKKTINYLVFNHSVNEKEGSPINENFISSEHEARTCWRVI